MARIASILLIVFAMANVAYGDLYRPCLCGPDNPYSCGMCTASRAACGAVPAPC